jgi:fatty acid-binding protein DegV
MIKYRKSEIYVLDSMSVGPQKGYIALKASSYRFSMNCAEAFVTLKDEVEALCSFAIIYDHSFITRSGLVSENSIKGGEQLGIKPVLTLTSTGELTIYKKARSEKNAVTSVIKYAEKFATDKTNFFVYTADNTRNELFVIKMLQDKFPGCSIKTGQAGMTNGILFAPNAIFIGFYAPRVRPQTTKKPLKIYSDIDKISEND